MNWSFRPVTSYEESLKFYPLLNPPHFSRPTSGAAVVEPLQFLHNFHAFTQNLFRNFDFTNCIVQGGAIVYSLLGLENAPSDPSLLSKAFLDQYPSSDIGKFSFFSPFHF